MRIQGGGRYEDSKKGEEATGTQKKKRKLRGLKKRRGGYGDTKKGEEATGTQKWGEDATGTQKRGRGDATGTQIGGGSYGD